MGISEYYAVHVFLFLEMSSWNQSWARVYIFYLAPKPHEPKIEVRRAKRQGTKFRHASRQHINWIYYYIGSNYAHSYLDWRYTSKYF